VIGRGGGGANAAAASPVEAGSSKQDPAVLYVVSRFPTVSETFIVNEWLRLAERLRLDFASLVESRERPIQPEAAQLLPVVRFVPLMHPGTVTANVSLLLRRPHVYLRLLLRVLRGSVRRPMGGILKGLVVFWKSVRLAQLVPKLDIGHVHAHFINHPATAAWIVSKLTGASFSVTAHANDLFVGPALLEEKVRDAAFVVAISEYNRQELLRSVPGADGVHVIRSGVEVDQFPYRERDQLTRLLCVARLADTKGHAYLLHAFASVAEEFPTISLELVGDGPERRRLESMVRSLGLIERVAFRGPLPSHEVRERLSRSDVFVLAALGNRTGAKDGIPVALIEAMASGAPVVTTEISGIPELVRHAETGLLAPPGDAEAFAAALRSLLADPARARRLARSARELVETEFTLRGQSDQLGALFTSVLSQRVPGRGEHGHSGDQPRDALSSVRRRRNTSNSARETRRSRNT
jgi:colanic acid/amylovoran biosynthesis glycosyltransferase